MKLTNPAEGFIDFIHSFFWPPQELKLKFQRCQSFSANRLDLWRKKSRINCVLANKILKSIDVFDGPGIRELIRFKVEERQDIFGDENLYITSFGESAKSGDVVFYDFRHTANFDKRFRFIDSIGINDVPAKSRIVFLDDLIGSGTQSVGFIKKKLLQLLAPSHRPCLFSLCGTTNGIALVRETGFEVICAKELREEKYDFFHASNNALSLREKERLKTLNEMLGRNDYDLGLLIAFYYGTPNNTMPFIWKEGFKYRNFSGRMDRWSALLPRKY